MEKHIRQLINELKNIKKENKRKTKSNESTRKLEEQLKAQRNIARLTDLGFKGINTMERGDSSWTKDLSQIKNKNMPQKDISFKNPNFTSIW